MRKPFYLILFCLIPFCAVSVQFASATPKDELAGYWKFLRGEGGPCAAQIRTLSYYFGRDGRYRAAAAMIPSGDYKVEGTYTATDTTAEVWVGGEKIGPYPYRIKNGLLVVDHPQFGCRVVLQREDY